VLQRFNAAVSAGYFLARLSAAGLLSFAYQNFSDIRRKSFY